MIKKQDEYKTNRKKLEEKQLVIDNKNIVARINGRKSRIDHKQQEADYLRSRNYSEMRSKFKPASNQASLVMLPKLNELSHQNSAVKLKLP